MKKLGHSDAPAMLRRCSGDAPAALYGAAHKIALCGLAYIALTGCTTVRYERVYCLSHDQFEQLKKSQPDKVRDKLTGKADIDVGILAGSAIRLRAHDDGLLEVLGGCVDPNTGAAPK